MSPLDNPDFANAIRNVHKRPQYGQISDWNGDVFEIVVADAPYFARLLKAALTSTNYVATEAEWKLLKRMCAG